MLPHKYRLPLRTELARVQKEGELFQGKFFSLLVAKSKKLETGNSKLETSRFSFIISTKIHKKATKRNRAKRVLSEAIAGLMPKVKPGFDVVVLAKKKIIGTNLPEIKKEVEKLFQKANLTI